MLSYIANFFKSLFPKSDPEFYIAPCMGDVVEFEDGSRKIVAYSKIEAEQLDVRFYNNIELCATIRGRQRPVMTISKTSESWPPKNCIVLRDGMQIYPQRNWRIGLVEKLSKLILKKG